MDTQKLEKILEDHKAWLKDKSGQRADLHGADLFNTDLHGANLRGADLHRADLFNTDLHGANLRGADLHDADLYIANLRGADLRDADLRGADLYYADIYRTDFRGADLRGADLGEDGVLDDLLDGVLFEGVKMDTKEKDTLSIKDVNATYIVVQKADSSYRPSIPDIYCETTEGCRGLRYVGTKDDCRNYLRDLALEVGVQRDDTICDTVYDRTIYKIGSDEYVDATSTYQVTPIVSEISLLVIYGMMGGVLKLITEMFNRHITRRYGND